MNILAAKCLLAGVQPPDSLAEVLGWCHRAPNEWPLQVAENRFLGVQPLLMEGEPTDLCRELAVDLGEAEAELCERQMVEVKTLAMTRRSQDSYVAVRRFLIEHAVASYEQLVMASLSPSLALFRDKLSAMYEPVPGSVIENGHLMLCGYCGWTLERRQGRLRCGEDRCRLLTANFTRGTGYRPVLLGEEVFRVRKAIRKYVVAPGIHELQMYAALVAFGLQVQLWPGFDCYDLRIHLAEGQIWAVDIKDWHYPHLLARHLVGLPSEGDLSWDHAFYAVPDQRIQDNPGYLSFLQSVTTQANFSVCSISGLLEAARARKRVPNA